MRLFLPHPVATTFAFVFAAAFLCVTPRFALLELLAVGFVFATYFEELCDQFRRVVQGTSAICEIYMVRRETPQSSRLQNYVRRCNSLGSKSKRNVAIAQVSELRA